MKVQLLPSTFSEDGAASTRQHLTCMVINDSVAFDAGSLAMATTERQKRNIRDVVISHAHLDHIAGLPLFIDDLFSTLRGPVRIHATESVVGVLEENIFNWKVYPRFSELRNDFGPVVEYVLFEPTRAFSVNGLTVLPIEVNHKVPSCGFVISDGETTIATTGDTAPTEVFWEHLNGLDSVNAVMVECAFPDELADLASISHHLTPSALEGELAKLKRTDCQLFVVNIKPAFRDRTVEQITAFSGGRIEVLEPGTSYELERPNESFHAEN